MSRPREAPDAWTVRREGSGYVLIRDLECQVCCKRKRESCRICGGTGRRQVTFDAIPRAEALELFRGLGLALGVVPSSG